MDGDLGNHRIVPRPVKKEDSTSNNVNNAIKQERAKPEYMRYAQQKNAKQIFMLKVVACFIVLGLIAVIVLIVITTGVFTKKAPVEPVKPTQINCPAIPACPACPSFPAIPSCPSIPACPACSSNKATSDEIESQKVAANAAAVLAAAQKLASQSSANKYTQDSANKLVGEAAATLTAANNAVAAAKVVATIAASATSAKSNSYFMYGPWISDNRKLPIERIVTINGEIVYMAQDASDVKMVTEKGLAAAYTGSINDFTNDKWTNTEKNADGNYKLNICPIACSTGCDAGGTCDSVKSTPKIVAAITNVINNVKAAVAEEKAILKNGTPEAKAVLAAKNVAADARVTAEELALEVRLANKSNDPQQIANATAAKAAADKAAADAKAAYDVLVMSVGDSTMKVQIDDKIPIPAPSAPSTAATAKPVVVDAAIIASVSPYEILSVAGIDVSMQAPSGIATISKSLLNNGTVIIIMGDNGLAKAALATSAEAKAAVAATAAAKAATATTTANAAIAVAAANAANATTAAEKASAAVAKTAAKVISDKAASDAAAKAVADKAAADKVASDKAAAKIIADAKAADEKLFNKAGSTSNFIYGPWISADRKIPVGRIVVINGEVVYMAQDGNDVKMISENGSTAAYVGSIDDFVNSNWINISKSREGNYKLNKCPMQCTNGCDDSGNCYPSYYMYGPWIRNFTKYLPVQFIAVVGNEKIFMTQDGDSVKMISLMTGYCASYTGYIKDFTDDKWSNADKNKDKVYRIRTCGGDCSYGCHDEMSACILW
jgi:hypothetical protein